ncbi:Outer membrane protein, beta-barrel [Paramyrothecium foliicola]|nr:Outer membrane protein, beta-barrel [Paramyrothecium foliicola]
MRFFATLFTMIGAAAATAATAGPVKAPSHDLLKFSRGTTPPTMPAFQAKIDWDLDNNHTISTPSGLRCSWNCREGYWYDPQGRAFGEIMRATDDGFVTDGPTPGTQYLELFITYVVRLDDGHWAYVKHTGGAIVRQYQNGIVRVETDSKKYGWLNQVDFVAPGSFDGTEVMTVNHYFPNTDKLPHGLPANSKPPKGKPVKWTS